MQLTDDQIGGLVILVWYIIVSVGAAMCLRKAGLPIWKGFVPFVNAVEICRLAGLSGMFVLTVFVPLLNLFVPLNVAMKLARRFGHSEGLGVVVWLSGFTLLPLLATGSRDGHAIDRSAGSESNPYDPGFAASPFVAARQTHSADDRHVNSRIRMIVLSVGYGFALMCVPGMMIVGTMAFGGATQDQIKQAEVVLGLFALTPISILAALIGGWILHKQRNYKAASSLVALPVLNALAVFVSFVWVMG